MPALTPVVTPVAAPINATDTSLLDHVPPTTGLDNVVTLPSQTVSVPVIGGNAACEAKLSIKANNVVTKIFITISL